MDRGRSSTEERVAFATTLTTGILLGLGALGAALAIDSLTFDLRWRYELQRHHAAGPALARSHTWLMGLAHTLPFVLGVTIVSWLAWQWQAERRLRRTSPSPSRFRPRTALLAWVVPAVNLVVPPLVMAELWAEAEPDHPDRRGFVLIAAWWLAILAAVALGVFALVSMPGTGATNADLIARDHRWVEAGTGAVVSTLLSLVVVVAINFRQASGAKRAAEADSPSWSGGVMADSPGFGEG